MNASDSLADVAFPIVVDGLAVSGLTKREYACIHLRVRRTGNAELNELIRISRIQELVFALIKSGITEPEAIESALGPLVGFLGLGVVKAETEKAKTENV